MWRAIGILAYGLAGSSGFLIADTDRPSRPNIVLLVSDDMGWNDVGYHQSRISTPHIDQLARDGIRLNRFYVHPVCSPTRTALMTGRLPARMGITGVIGRAGSVPKDEDFLPEWMHQAGYQTFMAGKWHLGMIDRASLPSARGFDQFFGFYGGGINYYATVGSRHSGWYRNGQSAAVEGYSTDLIAAEAIERLQRRDKNRPVFLYVAFNAPHPPAQAPERLIQKYQRLGFTGRRLSHAGAIEAMDAAIGRILATLKSEGMERDTLVMFFCDNGSGLSRRMPQFEPGQLKLRGGKGTLQEGGIRVPAVMRWPATIRSGATTDQLMGVQDLLPTLAALAAVPLKPAKPLDGVNCWPAIRDRKPIERPPVIVGGEGGGFAVLDGKWKLIWNSVGLSLFDIVRDPIEAHDLSAEQPLKAAELADRLRPIHQAMKELNP